MVAAAPIHHRDIIVLPPESQAIPECLVGPHAQETDVREARIDGRLAGAYRIEQSEPTRFRVVAIRVLPPWRRRGIGTWLLRHAIGLAESRGARIIDAPPVAEPFFQRSGFLLAGEQMRLALTPE